mmetsp:Transcript_45610/g.67241  ORF Transcript_45610/g.67241 Transcript_45610/m.67241 type:complete len:224 (-) Transcript_45610:593-1264(-)
MPVIILSSKNRSAGLSSLRLPGRIPLSLLELKTPNSNSAGFAFCNKLLGTLPVNEFFETSMRRILSKLSNGGSRPENALLDKLRFSSRTISCSLAGMSPLNLFPWRLSTRKRVNSPISSGRLPSSSLLFTEKCTNLRKVPISEGSVPVKPLNSSLSCCIDETFVSSLGIFPRSRFLDRFKWVSPTIAYFIPSREFTFASLKSRTLRVALVIVAGAPLSIEMST